MSSLCDRRHRLEVCFTFQFPFLNQALQKHVLGDSLQSFQFVVLIGSSNWVQRQRMRSDLVKF
jgi:hypothetical protein